MLLPGDLETEGTRWCEEGDKERPLVNQGVDFPVVTGGRPDWEVHGPSEGHSRQKVGSEVSEFVFKCWTSMKSSKATSC